MAGQLLQNPFRKSGPRKTYTQQLIALFAWPKKKPVGMPRGLKISLKSCKNKLRYNRIKNALNPWTYTQIYTPTDHRGTRGWGWLNPFPEFLVCCSIPKRFCLQWKAFDNLNKMRYILWVVALLEACDFTNNSRHLGRHLGFYQELENRLKLQEMVTFVLDM